MNSAQSSQPASDQNSNASEAQIPDQVHKKNSRKATPFRLVIIFGIVFILSFLVAIAVPIVSQLIDEKKTSDTMEAELDDVWLAMVKVMTDIETDDVIPQTTWTNDLTMDIAVNDNGSMSEFLQGSDDLSFYYQWDSNGILYQCETDECPDPLESTRKKQPR